MDREWLIGYLREALELLETRRSGANSWTDRQAATEELQRRQVQISQVVERILPGFGEPLFQSLSSTEKTPAARYLNQAIYTLEEGDKIARAFGPPPGPALRADALHPTVWQACASLWRSNHRRDAVNAAANAVNAAMQDRLGRRDVSNTDLVRQAFTLDDPQPGRPRLRLAENDGGETYASLHNGAREFSAGCYMAIRNTGSAHTAAEEPSEHEALEQLAAFSILARWIERAVVVAAHDP